MKEKISLFFLSLTAERVENHEKSFFLSVSNKIITISETSQIIAIILHFPNLQICVLINKTLFSNAYIHDYKKQRKDDRRREKSNTVS